MSGPVNDGGSEDEEKEGCDNRGWEDQTEQATLAVDTLADPFVRVGRRQQRCVRHFFSVTER